MSERTPQSHQPRVEGQMLCLGARLRITAQHDTAVVRLATRTKRRELCSVFTTAFGFALPSEALTSARFGGITAMSTAPDTWLVKASSKAALDGLAHLAPVASVIDVTDAQFVVRIDGPDCREFLSSCCPLDLEGEALASGRCANTKFAAFDVLLDALEAASIEVHVARSYSRDFWDTLKRLAERRKSLGV